MTKSENPGGPIDLPAQLRHVDDRMPGIRRRRLSFKGKKGNT